MTLDQAKEGQRVRIEGFVGDDLVLQRLMEMGLLEDEEVEVVGFAPLGDPMEIRLRDYRLSLRQSEAARIRVILILPDS
ncbi:MAG: ferrous iron transport protein A [Planctomycetes bacterium]|nr:ferrous iron transport protein A [Planctomycetota bacterium]